jgi:hypothetical protein
VIPLVSILWLAACGGQIGSSEFEPDGSDTDVAAEDSDSEAATEDTDLAEEDSDTTPEEPDEPTVDVRTFAMLQRTRSLVDHPVWGSTSPSDTTALMLVAWERDGEQATWEEVLCGLESTKVHGTTTSYPAAFIDGIPLRTRTAEIEGFERGDAFDAGPLIDVIGADLADEADDPLPADADAPTEYDQDGDGKPGMTVNVDNNLLGKGDVYVAQRATTTLSGEVVADDRIEGSLSWSQEQVTLGATKDWLLLDTNSRPDTSALNNFFILQEVEESTTCDDVIADQLALFGI